MISVDKEAEHRFWSRSESAATSIVRGRGRHKVQVDPSLDMPRETHFRLELGKIGDYDEFDSYVRNELLQSAIAQNPAHSIVAVTCLPAGPLSSPQVEAILNIWVRMDRGALALCTGQDVFLCFVNALLRRGCRLRRSTSTSTRRCVERSTSEVERDYTPMLRTLMLDSPVLARRVPKTAFRRRYRRHTAELAAPVRLNYACAVELRLVSTDSSGSGSDAQ